MLIDAYAPPPPALSVHFASNPDPDTEDVTVRFASRLLAAVRRRIWMAYTV